ncbi:MAG: hypothetical protein K6F37_03460 [Lachnospiraceae bacterium]|nr:hypothetical protein [Lachnospiraceae bacterium]
MKDMIFADFGNFNSYDTEPEWMKNERYEYCEGFLSSSEKTPLTEIEDFIKGFFRHAGLAS